MSNENDVLTAREVAALLRISVATVSRFTRNGRIPHFRVGNKIVRYPAPEVMSLMVAQIAVEQGGVD